MRRFLDRIYVISGALSAIIILTICCVVCLQVAFNIVTRLGFQNVTPTIPSYADISGFLLAAASFFALAYTLTRGGHIRVTLLFAIFGERFRFIADLFSLSVCGVISGAGTYYMAQLTSQSYQFGDKSPGILAIPIWIGQVPLTLGLGILTIAFADLFVRTLQNRQPLPEIQPME